MAKLPKSLAKNYRARSSDERRSYTRRRHKKGTPSRFLIRFSIMSIARMKKKNSYDKTKTIVKFNG
jgi:hypothetical protein